MRLITWNINGVRTLPQYHPFVVERLKTFDDILNALEADIICFQEMKSGRRLLRYSGVATYTRSSVVVPVKAEEGLTGALQPKPPLKSEEKISTFEAYPPTIPAGPSQEGEETEEVDFAHLDSEGRAVVTDMGLFVLINTYCPNDSGTPEREKFKMQYHRLIEARVRTLIEEGRDVIVVGDINACAAGLAMGLEGEEGFWGAEYRRWLRDWLQENGGPLVDVTRRFWPDRKGMFTCWNTKISARESNYGTRIDYILATPALMQWIKGSDTQPQVKGSDHCPVYVDFHDSIVGPSSGQTLLLADVLGAPRANGKIPDPPRIATKWWEEFSGKQTSLAQFFGKKSASNVVSTPSSSSVTPVPTSQPIEAREEASSPTTTSASPPASLPNTAPAPPSSSSTATKRKLVANDPTSQSKKSKKGSVSTSTKARQGQSSIASFFAKPAASKSQQKEKEDEDSAEDEDYKLALQLSQEVDTDFAPPSSSQASEADAASSQKSKQAWTTLLAPIQPPLCKGHLEPAKEFTVNKPGPNKGKKFFLCSR
ncbi:DNA-lyase 2 [Coprinopsis sp. MPI-PUGE-AT-0042]|nr:DNA-lyase 2 [Coprinopsis sp. MPI-PUGE-AT-0042]